MSSATLRTENYFMSQEAEMAASGKCLRTIRSCEVSSLFWSRSKHRRAENREAACGPVRFSFQDKDRPR